MQVLQRETVAIQVKPGNLIKLLVIRLEITRFHHFCRADLTVDLANLVSLGRRHQLTGQTERGCADLITIRV
jgi:hypothetical protein